MNQLSIKTNAFMNNANISWAICSGFALDLFLKKDINYNEQEILDLYRSVGWINYTNNPEMLRNAFAHSLMVYAAFINDKLAGVIRIVGDGRYLCMWC